MFARKNFTATTRHRWAQENWMMPRTRGFWLAIALVMIMALAACGGDSGDENGDENGNGGANQGAAPTPTVETDAPVGTPQLGVSLAPQLALGGANDSTP